MKVPWDRGGLRTYLTLIALICARPEPVTFWWALPLLLLGITLHVYAKGCLRQNQVVSIGGPYRFVRHPFYTANLMIDMSIALMSGYWPLIALLPVWWFLVYVPVMREEEAYLTKMFPEVYPAYQKSLPRLIPFRRPWPKEGEQFSWRNRNIISDTVFPRALKLIALPLIFSVWWHLRARGITFLTQAPGYDLWAVCLLAMLYGVSWALKHHLRDNRRLVPEAVSRWARPVAALALMAIAGTVRRLEIESSMLPIAAGFALAATLLVYWRSATAQLIAEAVALMAILTLCKLPWLMPVPILLYTPLVLDQLLLAKTGEEQPAKSRPRLAALSSYHAIVALGVIIAVLKEMM